MLVLQLMACAGRASCCVRPQHMGVHVIHRERPGSAKESRNSTQQTTATVTPNGRRPAPLTDQTLGSAAESTHASSHRTPASTAPMSARQIRLGTRMHAYVSVNVNVRGCLSGSARTRPIRAATIATFGPTRHSTAQEAWQRALSLNLCHTRFEQLQCEGT